MTNENTDRYSKIAKDCFWEYHFSAEEIEQLFKSSDKRDFAYTQLRINICKI